MKSNEYRFVTHWHIRAPREEVFAILTDSKSLTRWWPAVYRAVDQLAPPTEPNGVGKRLGLHTQGWLPYRLHWELLVTAHESPSRLAFAATGDFVGRGEWTLAENTGVTVVKYEWTIRADKALLKRLSLLFKPIFAMNHRWAMARGRESLELEIRRRRGEAVGSPPAAVSAWWSGFVVVTVLGACTAAALAIWRWGIP
jgi:uncharacterized protein YndB with AHSA1/START domain